MGVPFPAARRWGVWSAPDELWVAASVTYNDPTGIPSSLILAEAKYALSAGEILEIPIGAAVPARMEAYNVTCTASRTRGGAPIAVASSVYHYLPPNPYGGSTIQLDTLTGSLLVLEKPRQFPGELTPEGYHTFFPIGYYTGWSNYLASNFSLLREIKAAGFTLVHPIPGGGPARSAWGRSPASLDHFMAFMDACEDVGLWVMYDMRHTFQSAAEVTLQTTLLRSHPALLLWYTADEPDGQNNPTNSTLLAYNLIQTLDGYHPISFTPNCQNYFFSQYASGADIVIPDVYPIGNNPTVSTVYHTPCNRTYGCCGCDNCPGTLQDLGTRITEMREYTRWTGTAKTFWGVSQAFGESEFWVREPTGKEMVAMSENAISAGAKGLLYWSAPASREIWEATGKVARRVNPPPPPPPPPSDGERWREL